MKKTRDMQIAEAVRYAIEAAIDSAANEWHKHNFPAEKNAAVACAGIANRIDLPSIIASVEAPEPVCELANKNFGDVMWYTDRPEVGTKLYTSPPPAENSGEAINKRLLDALKDMCNAEEAMFNLTYGAWYSDCAIQDLPPIDQFVIKVRGTIAAAEKEVGK